MRNQTIPPAMTTLTSFASSRACIKIAAMMAAYKAAMATAITIVNMPRSTNPDTAALEEQEIDENLSDIDKERYKTDEAYRDKLQADIELAYQRAAGRV